VSGFSLNTGEAQKGGGNEAARYRSEFRSLCREIVAENQTEEEWAEMESDDMFQSESYVGGYDADEEAFCFSHYAPDGEEYWFQVTLPEVQEVAAGGNPVVEVRPIGGTGAGTLPDLPYTRSP
jgi:hypothetical protein